MKHKFQKKKQVNQLVHALIGHGFHPLKAEDLICKGTKEVERELPHDELVACNDVLIKGVGVPFLKVASNEGPPDVLFLGPGETKAKPLQDCQWLKNENEMFGWWVKDMTRTAAVGIAAEKNKEEQKAKVASEKPDAPMALDENFGLDPVQKMLNKGQCLIVSQPIKFVSDVFGVEASALPPSSESDEPSNSGDEDDDDAARGCVGAMSAPIISPEQAPRDQER